MRPDNGDVYSPIRSIFEFFVDGRPQPAAIVPALKDPPGARALRINVYASRSSRTSHQQSDSFDRGGCRGLPRQRSGNLLSGHDEAIEGPFWPRPRFSRRVAAPQLGFRSSTSYPVPQPPPGVLSRRYNKEPCTSVVPDQLIFGLRSSCDRAELMLALVMRLAPVSRVAGTFSPFEAASAVLMPS